MIDSDLLNNFIVHLECPQLQASRQLCDGGEGEKELFSAAQGDSRVDQLSFLDLLLLLLCGDHCEYFLVAGREKLGRRWENRRIIPFKHIDFFVLFCFFYCKSE